MDTKNQQIQNLRSFTKLYGYIKYFHPSDEASQIDWDKFAIYGTEKVKNVQSSEELKVILESLFLPIAPTIQIYYKDKTPTPVSLTNSTKGLNLVTWQHNGLGINPYSTYKSVRLGRIDNSIKSGNNISQTIIGKNFKDKQFRITARVKADVKGSNSNGYLFHIAFNSKHEIIFEDNMRNRPIRLNEWKDYDISGQYTDDTPYIVIGVELTGKGKLWIDKIQFFVRDENGNWENIHLENLCFEKTKGDYTPTNWDVSGYGYEYKVTKDEKLNGKSSLFIKSIEGSLSGSLFEKFPKAGEVINKEIGSGLSCQIPLTLYSDTLGTLGQKNRTSFDNLLSKLNKIDINKFTADTKFVRLGNIVITWNVFQHFYPYFNVVGTDWDKELTDVLKEVMLNVNEQDFYYTINRTVAKLHDGHGYVDHKNFSNQVGFKFIAEWIEDQMVITSSQDKSIFKVGDIILSVDGVPSEQILHDEEEYISGSPQYKRWCATRVRFGYGKEGTTAKIRLKRNGQAIVIEAIRSKKDRLSKSDRLNIEEIAKEIFYVNLSKADMKEINGKIHDLANAKGVIFDLRGYPNSNHEIISHLLKEPDTSNAWLRVPQIIYPDQENVVGYTNNGWYMQPKKPHIKGKVVFLTDGRAISYAESFMSFIEHYKLAEIVGQPTAGTNGDINPFLLPGGFEITWTGTKVVKHDGSQHHLIGIQPTVSLQRTIKGVIEGRDEYLEKALEIIKGD